MNHPVCFLHFPKSAGSSMFAALEAALPAGSISPFRNDRWAFGRFNDFDALRDRVRRTVAVEEHEIQSLAGYRAVFGHFDLDTLLRVAPPCAISTVLREPRARLLSLYMFARFTPGLAEEHYPFDGITGSDGPLDGFLDSLTDGINGDNQITRMLLRGDPRVPKGNLIDAADVEALADAALARLDQLGFVGILETGAEVWDGLSRVFGVELKPVSVNVSGELGYRPGSFPVPDWDAPRAVRLLEELTTVDAIVYERLIERRLGDQRAARRYADAAFVRQLARFGAASGQRLAEAQARVAEQVSALVHLHTEVATRDATVASLHEEVVKGHATAVWLHEEVAKRDATVASLHEEVVKGHATAVWLHEEVAKRDATVASLHEDVAKRDATAVWLHEEVAKRDATMASLHEDVAKRDATVVWLHEGVSTRDATVAWLHEEVAKRDATAVWLHEEVAKRDAIPGVVPDVNGRRVVTALSPQPAIPKDIVG